MSNFVILGNILKIMCSECGEINNIPTGKRHRRNVWDVNTKFGAGISLPFIKG
jgi:hypothetical protein